MFFLEWCVLIQTCGSFQEENKIYNAVDVAPLKCICDGIVEFFPV